MFGENLKIARKRKGFTLEQLAEKYNKHYNGGLSKGTLSKYENNKQEPMISTVGNLASILDVSVDFLLNETILAGEMEAYGLRPVKLKKFPMLREIACGEPNVCNQEYEIFVEASADMKADFCLTAKGDSMINARIFDGDVVFIQSMPIVDSGMIAAMIINDEATLKRIYIKEDKIILHPENPIYDDMVYEKEEMNEIRILGKAVACMSNVR